MKITSNKTILKKISENTYDINFGTLKSGSDASIAINFENASHISVTKTCGCTMPTILILPQGGFDLVINYDSKKIGVINQSVFEKIVNNKNEQETITFNLKGIITE